MLEACPAIADTPLLPLRAAAAEPIGWSPELIASLDWLRVAELARAIAEYHGCELAQSCVLADGSLLFGMLEQPQSAQPQR
ncbi:MAG TPA: hypothetical protein VD994_10220, partial [Prosthecobacter sp.]|nr:hypothetical protein [Prosthecobacter sp.]